MRRVKKKTLGIGKCMCKGTGKELGTERRSGWPGVERMGGTPKTETEKGWEPTGAGPGKPTTVTSYSISLRQPMVDKQWEK